MLNVAIYMHMWVWEMLKIFLDGITNDCDEVEAEVKAALLNNIYVFFSFT